MDKSYAEMQDNQRKVILCHYPVMCYNGQYRLDRKGNPRTYMLYGHVHDTMDQRLLEQFQEITKRNDCTKSGWRGEADSQQHDQLFLHVFGLYAPYAGRVDCPGQREEKYLVLRIHSDVYVRSG